MKNTKGLLIKVLLFVTLFASSATSNALTKQMEALDRGVLAVKTNTGVYVSWRLLGTDKPSVSFNLYRDGVLLNSTPISTKTNFVDKSGNINSKYVVKAVENGVETSASDATPVWGDSYKTIQLKRPAGGSNKSGSYTYSPNDMSVGDVDGDGQYELIVKWNPSDAHDNSEKGYTGNVYLDCYKLDGTFLWRIDLGVNIRAGAHYTQFQVFDFDGDGKAEVACKTAPGTKDGKGNYVLMEDDKPTDDYRNSSGYVLSGKEYLTVFEGATGAELSTVKYYPERGSVSSWGDSYGNRVDRFLACTAYLDGVHPSLVVCRGYYTRSTLTAYDFKNGQLVLKWSHDSAEKGKEAYGEGFHNLSVCDVDDDGYDEIVYGSATIDNDGKLYSRTGYGHGDAQHVSRMRKGDNDFYGFFVHEEKSSAYGFELRNLNSNKVLRGEKTGTDVGRGCAADIDSESPGFEFWSGANYNVYSFDGTIISSKRPSINFRIYWDGDLQDELLDGTKISKWNSSKKYVEDMVDFTKYGAYSSCNTTKATPCLSADILGDWREEVILWDSSDPSKIAIFTTTIPSDYRLTTLMHDPVYRCGVAWQNTAYNQPPHLSYYIGEGLSDVPTPDIYVPGGQPVVRDTATIGRSGSGGARNQTVKVGEPIKATIYNYTNANKLLVVGSLPFGVTAVDNKGKLTISGTPIVVGKYSYTLQTAGPNVNVEGPGGTLTVVPDTNTDLKKVAYVTDPTAANYQNDQKLLPALLNSTDFYVVQVDAQQKEVDFSDFDLIVISEVAASNAPLMSSLKGVDKPMLNMKVHAYKTSDATWSWAQTGYGDENMTTSLVICEGKQTHPIFNGLEMQSNEINLLTEVNNKGFTYMNPENFNSVEGGIEVLARIKGEYACIFEAAPGTIISGTKLSQKYMQIGINSSSLNNMTDNAVKLINNACLYLLGMNDVTSVSDVDNVSPAFVYPNPATSEFTLQIESLCSQSVDLKLYNMLGEKILVQNIELKEGVNEIKIMRGSIPSGCYLLCVGEIMTKLILK